MQKQCKFGEAWVGRCKSTCVVDSDYCVSHKDMMCCSCGEKATHTCNETGQFACGALLCNNCEHTIVQDGTNGGVGFAKSPLPKGMKSHCKKTDQIYTPWYMRDEG